MTVDQVGLPEFEVKSLAERLVLRHGSKATAIANRFILESANAADRASWLAISLKIADLLGSASLPPTMGASSPDRFVGTIPDTPARTIARPAQTPRR